MFPYAVGVEGIPMGGSIGKAASAAAVILGDS